MASYYANINSSYTGTGHAGTTGDPWSYADFKNALDSCAVSGGDSVFLFGSVSTTYWNFALNSITIDKWDGTNPGPTPLADPWGIRMNCTGYSSARLSDGNSVMVFKNGTIVVYNTQSDGYNLNGIDSSSNITLINMRVINETSGNVSFVIDEGNYPFVALGSTLIGGGSLHIKGSTGGQGAYTFQDTIISITGLDFTSFTGSPIICNNNVFTTLTDANLNATNCQFSWTAPTWPAWDAAKELWASSIATGINTPPEPGNSPYTGYDTDPWGNARDGIGALYMSGTTTTTTTTPAPTTTTTTTPAPTTTTTTTTTTLSPTTTTTLSPTTTEAPMPIDILDISSSLNVMDFKIASVLPPVLSVDFTKVTLTYTGQANPQNTAVDITTYQYSLDNGVTWSTMTVATGSEISGVTFSIAGTTHPFVWGIKEDLGNNMYNTSIKVRFRATATFDTDVVLTDYKTFSVYLKKIISTPAAASESPFEAEYKGTAGNDLMKNAPRSNA